MHYHPSLHFSHSAQQQLTPSPQRAERKYGFTLAETLITLVIIGVVAAFTVPAMITKYQKEQTVTKLKKAYSTLSQTAARAIADNGPIETWEMGEDNSSNDALLFIKKYIIPYVSIMKEPQSFTSYPSNKDFIYLNGESAHYGDNWVRFYLNDGTAVSCSIEQELYRLRVDIDINGDKKPNKVGKDIFLFHYYVNSPYAGSKLHGGGSGASRDRLLSGDVWACNKEDRGTYCSGLIMTDGWKISDDYPW